MARSSSKHPRNPGREGPWAKTTLRVIGGSMRGRLLEYDGDPQTRPMKDRVREAVFNLVGTAAQGKLAVDLFAGTGALAIEAISRGALRAVLIERRFPVVKTIQKNLETLGIADRCQVHAGDALVWAARNVLPAELPWLVFCSPPYELYVSRTDDMLKLIQTMLRGAPTGSLVVVECDDRLDVNRLASLGNANSPTDWDVRRYPPAVIAIHEKN